MVTFSDNDETETETIYSCQGHDTVTVNDDTEESEAETDDDYDVNEYEPETGDEAERPPQVQHRLHMPSNVSAAKIKLRMALVEAHLSQEVYFYNRISVAEGRVSKRAVFPIYLHCKALRPCVSLGLLPM